MTTPAKTRLRYSQADRKRGLSNAGRSDDLLLSIISDYQEASKYRLTPSRLVQIIADADAGDPREQAALFPTLLEKEPLLAAHLNTRRLAVLSKPWRVRSEKQPELADEITDALSRSGLQKALGWLLAAVGFGYAGVAVDWLEGGAGVASFRPIANDRWLFDEGGHPALSGADGRPIPLAEFHPAQIMFLVNDGAAGLPCRAGLLRTLLWLHMFKNAAFAEWNRFLERFGMPFLLGKIPAGDFSDEKKRQVLLASLLQVRSGGAGVGTTETTMDLLNGAAGNNSEAFESHQRYCDEIMTLTVLGQLASSDRGSGLSQGGMQEEVRQDLLEADCAMLSEVVQNRLVDWLCRLRYGLDDTRDMCFVIDCQKAEDLNVRADRDEKIARAAGCKLKRDYVAEVYGVDLEEPEPEPEMIPGVPPAGKKADDEQTAMTDDGRKAATAGNRLIRATIGRMVDEDALAAWRIPIDAAIRKAFGDLDPADPELVAKFRERGPAFLASLPGVMDQFDARAFEDALQGALLAGFLNGALPVDFWRKTSS